MASNIKDEHLELEEECLFSTPITSPQEGEIVIQPYRSMILAQRHKPGVENEIDGFNSQRGEGLPYALNVIPDLLRDDIPQEDDNKERAFLSSEPLYVALLWRKTLDNWLRGIPWLKVNSGLLDEWLAEIPTLFPLLTKWSHTFKSTEFFISISDVPIKGWPGIIQEIALLLQNISNHDGTEYIFATLSKIPADEREKFLQHAQPLLEGVTDGYERARILEIISKIPADEREEVSQYAQPLLEGVTDGHGRVRILETIGKTPADEREEVSQYAQPRLERDRGVYKNTWILDIIGKIPTDEREKVPQYAQPLLEGVTERYGRIWILETIGKIPADEREKFLQYAQPLLEGVTDGDERALILETIYKIPADEREKFLQYAQPLLEQVTDGYERAHTIKILRKILLEKREDLLHQIEPLLTGVKDNHEIMLTLQVIRNIPLATREIKYISILRQEFDLLRTTFLESGLIRDFFSKIPLEQRTALLEQGKPFLSYANNPYEKILILGLVKMLGEEGQNQLFLSLPSFNKIKNSLQRAFILHMLKARPFNEWNRLLGETERATITQDDPFYVEDIKLDLEEDEFALA